MNYYIGIDIGTTGAKALLVDERGTVCAQAASEYSFSTPKSLWCEQNPADWWNATRTVFRELVDKTSKAGESIKGIGLTGQMHGLVLLDERGEVLRPCIMWNDQRTGSQCENITEKIGYDRLLNLIANPVLPGFTLPKILWVRENEPDIYKKIVHIVLPKDYIRYKLTGEFATDVSDASGMAVLDVAHRKWNDELLDELSVPREWLPKVYESPEVTGVISNRASEQTGLQEGIPVVAGGGDQAAGAVGCGIVSPGIVSVTIGTSGVVFAHSDQMALQPEGKLHSFCHAVPGAWHLMGVTLAAGGSLRWYRDTFATQEIEQARQSNIEVYDVLLKRVQKINAGADGVFFLPYLAGERTPYPDPGAQGVFFGLSLRHTRDHLLRAVMEGVGYSLRDCLELVKSVGVPITQIRLSGGGARSAVWRQIIADIFNEEVITLNTSDGAPYGAALLAAVGTEKFSSVREACDATIAIGERHSPNPENTKRYEDGYTIYKELYPSLKKSFQQNTQLLTKYM